MALAYASNDLEGTLVNTNLLRDLMNQTWTRNACLFAVSSVLLVTTSGERIVAQDTAVPKQDADVGDKLAPVQKITAKVVPVIDAINDAMQPFIDHGEISGVVTLVGHRGEVVHLGALGLANLELNTPMRARSTFAIASMTKPITATALMVLVEEGKVSLDDPVSKYLPKFANLTLKNGDPLARGITIRDAVTHTSGLGGTQTFQGSLAEFVDGLADRPLDFQPGTKWKYSPGMNVVGRIIEVVSKQPFEDFLKERIFKTIADDQHDVRADTSATKDARSSVRPEQGRRD